MGSRYIKNAPLVHRFRVVLKQELPGLSEARAGERGRDDIPAASYSFRLFNGKQIHLHGANLYRLGEKLCKGPYTGEDFCDVSEGGSSFGLCGCTAH